jgi:glucose-6-phosphate-specific signal transduction histidine kinase
VDQPVQRVCPHCARISFESGARCPYCGQSFRRRTGLVGMALLLFLFAVVVLGGMLLMLIAAGNEADRKLDREVNRVERNLNQQFDDIQGSVRQELDRRLPAETPTP